MQKYLVLFDSIPTWLPFIGLMNGKSKAIKSPLATRLVEAGILAMVPLIIGMVWVIPKLEVMASIQHSALTELTKEVRSTKEDTARVRTSIAVLENNVARMDLAIGHIDEIANTKVRSVEGRLDSIERSLRK